MHGQDPLAEVLLLGPVELVRDGVAVPVDGEKARGVLATLALSAGRVVPVERLIDGIWGEEPPAEAQNAVQYHVSRLRRILTGIGAGGALVTRPPGYLLQVRSDWSRFGPLTERSAAIGAERPEQAVALLAEALQLWRGPALADLRRLPFAAARGPALDAARLGAVASFVQFGVDGPDPASWVPRLEELVAEHPTRERLWVQLMLALYRSGQQVQALEAYRRLREYLADELGVEPSSEVRTLQARILAQDDGLLVRPVGTPVRPQAWRGLDVADMISTRRRTDVQEERAVLELPDGRSVELRDTVRVGRTPDCDIVLNDPDVSRRHAEVLRHGADWAVRDLGSTNGTRVDGRRVQGVVALRDGARMTVGSTEIRYRLEAP
jgi:DNA-binding SARP family transcriptional activator